MPVQFRCTDCKKRTKCTKRAVQFVLFVLYAPLDVYLASEDFALLWHVALRDVRIVQSVRPSSTVV